MAQYKDGDSRTINGVTYVRSNGQWLPGGGATALTGADPRLGPQVQKAQVDAATATATAPYAAPKAAADAAQAQAQARVAEAQAAIANAKNATDLKIAQADLAKTQAELQQLQAGKGSALDALQMQLDRVGDLYRQNIKGSVLPNIANAAIPDSFQPSVGQFNSAAQGLFNPFMAAFRIPGVGSQSDTELRQFMEANTPSPNDTNAVIEEKMRNIQTRIDAEREARGQAAPSANALPQLPPDQQTLATGGTRDVVDPILKAEAGKIGAMVAQGVPDAQIKDFMTRSGINPADTSIDQALQFRQTDAFKKWQRANPGQPYPVGPSFYTKQVPMTATRAALNAAAADGTAGALVAAPVAAANALSGGYLNDAIGAMGGNAQEAQNGIDLLRSQHPFASLGGDVAGYATAEGLAGLAPGFKALAATKYGRRGIDALYGAYSGSGENDDNRGLGALTGTVVNTGGGMFGRGLQKASGAALTGLTAPKVRYLDQQGIPLTIGQIGRGTDTTLGNTIGGLEDRAAGIPIFDAIINSARRRGEEGFNRAAFRQAGGSGVTGARGVEELQNNVNNAYSFLDPVNLPLDAQFAGSNAAVRATLPDLPKFGPEIDSSLNLIDRASANGGLSGRDWQQALRTVKGDKASLRGKEFSTGAIDAMDDVENNLLGLASRQSPADLQGNLASANTLNKHFKTITGALDNTPTQARGELFTPTRLDTASRASQRKFGGQTSSMKGERPFYELTKNAMDVMPNQVPDSGTAGRALMYSALFGAGLGSGLGYANEGGDGALQGAGTGAAVVPFALAAIYSKGGQRALQRAMLGERPEIIQKIGERLKMAKRIGGMFGASAARDYFLQPELPQ